MKNKVTRSKGQKLLPCAASEALLAVIDRGMEMAGYANRAQFVRDAILHKLNKTGRNLHPGLAQAPSRAGKGGPKKRRRA